jgi:hypothetical protein
VNVLDAGDDEAHFTGFQINGGSVFGLNTPTLSTWILPVD